jgi:hypothetical protein
MEVHGGGYSGTTKLSSGRLVLHFARNHFFRLIPQNGYYTGLAGYAVPAMLEMALLPFREKKKPGITRNHGNSVLMNALVHYTKEALSQAVDNLAMSVG